MCMIILYHYISTVSQEYVPFDSFVKDHPIFSILFSISVLGYGKCLSSFDLSRNPEEAEPMHFPVSNEDIEAPRSELPS